MIGAFGGHDAAVQERRECPLRRQPDAGVHAGHELFSPRRHLAPRDQRADTESIDRLHRNGHSRAEQAALIQVVVARVTSAVGERHLRSDRIGIEAVDGAGVPASVSDPTERGKISAVVSLRAVRESKVVAMLRRRTRRVFASDDPGRDITLRERRARGPVGMLADRRAHGEVSDAPRKITRREELLRRFEGAGREQVELARERRRRKKVRGELRRRRRHTAEESRIAEDAGVGRSVAGQNLVGHRHVFEDSAARVTQTPRHLTVVVVDRRAAGGRASRSNGLGRRWRIGSRTRTGSQHRDWPSRTQVTHRDRRRHARARPHVDQLSTRRHEPVQVGADQIRSGRQGAEHEASAAIRHGECRRRPRADTIAPGTGAPCSSCTVPSIVPGAIEASWVTDLRRALRARDIRREA